MPDESLSPSIAALSEKIQTDRLTRLKLISRLSDTLIELGADPDEVARGLPSLDIASDAVSLPNDTQLVIISRSDSRRNTTSIIIF